ncbi:hypothetical protein BT93_G2325 [Corymbia citriodora subsp. variegata]|nr:hypothetical protein BT93_G2325 [Corymbia citriodora subsp. variegata]
MAVSDVEAVLEFLRKNGFSEAESALKEDLVEKRDLGSSDFEKFLFPMAPPPPPVRLPSGSRRPGLVGGGGGGGSVRSSGASSDDRFVSVGSSTSDVCSSEFVNPYGVRSASRTNSDASSDRLSQFGTAREYNDYDLQNDLYWYDDKDDGHFLTPSFRGSEPFACPTQDKFITNSESEKYLDNSVDLNGAHDVFRLDSNGDYSDKPSLYDMAFANEGQKLHVFESRHFDEEGQYELFNGKEADSRPYGGGLMYGSYLNLQSNNTITLKDVEGVCSEDNSGAKHIANASSDRYATKHTPDDSVDWPQSSSDVQKRDCGEEFIFESMEKNEDVDDPMENGDIGNHEAVGGQGEESVFADEILMQENPEDEYEIFDLRIVHRKNRTGFEENKDLPIVLNTVIAGRYYVTEYLGSAAFSKVVQAHDLYMGVDVCLKIIKNDKDFFDQSLDEIKLLKLVNKHDPADECHILRLYDYFYHQEHLFIVCELLRANLYEFQKFNQESGGEPYFTLNRLQIITRQCLEALDYLHQLGIIHCDLKPENILIKSYRRSEIKVIDLGSSCFKSDNLCLYVQSRSYRAPEVILGLPYDQKIDIWSLGCILAELCSGEVLFPNDAIVMILARMIGMFGPIDQEMLERGQETPKYFTEEYDLYFINEETNQLEYIIPEESSLEGHVQVSDIGFLDFLRNLLEIDPKRRPTASEALEHPWLSHKYSFSC